VVALPDDAEMRHVEAAVGEFADGFFGVLMPLDYRDNRVLVFRLMFHDGFLG
jgi:hypothetical protein